MASPLAKQRQALISKAAPTPITETGVDTAKSLHLHLLDLETDIRFLSGFNRIEDKIKHKREVLVPKYRPYVTAYLESGEQYDNPVFAQLIIWLFDIEDLETAIDWCDKAIERELDTPERFNRDFATFCSDEVLKWSEKMANQGHSVEPYFTDVFYKVRETWRINEKLTAKWFKFAGLHLLRDSDGEPKATAVGDIEVLEKALNYLEEADKQYANVGVKTMMDKIQQRIRAIQEGRL
ncbi:phage terminase small subunit [Aliivibrio kagoshimensis]|uniref:phage terminase small subunit n=1 Tax=Aliivibrio kagoshimensis TaxID=2910230 RepID=UPI003D0EC0A6